MMFLTPRRLCYGFTALVAIGLAGWFLVRVHRESSMDEFVGTVVDQDGVPIGGVPIRIVFTRPQRRPGFEPDDFHSVHVKTDMSGQFRAKWNYSAVHIEPGPVPGIVVPTRHQVPLSFTNTGGAHRPGAPSRPLVIVAWRLGPSEPHISERFRRVFNDATSLVCLSLKNATASQSAAAGDLAIEVREGPGQTDKVYIRSLAKRGGVQRCLDPLPYRAPSDGYSAEIEIPEKSAESKRGQEYQFEAYLDGGETDLFAFLRIEVYASNRRIREIQIVYVLNPTRSRNLYPDPAKRIPID